MTKRLYTRKEILRRLQGVGVKGIHNLKMECREMEKLLPILRLMKKEA